VGGLEEKGGEWRSTQRSELFRNGSKSPCASARRSPWPVRSEPLRFTMSTLRRGSDILISLVSGGRLQRGLGGTPGPPRRPSSRQVRFVAPPLSWSFARAAYTGVSPDRRAGHQSPFWLERAYAGDRSASHEVYPGSSAAGKGPDAELSTLSCRWYHPLGRKILALDGDWGPQWK
jgi:hypothetical protein